MKIAVRLAVLALVAVAVIWLCRVLFPSPEIIIRKRLAETARAASFVPGQSTFSRLAGAQRLADYFATNVEVTIELPGHQQQQWTGREEILQAAVSARATLESLKVAFPDISLTLEPDKESATADLTAEAKISGDADLYVQEMKFMLRKMGGQWLITKVETVQTIQVPARQ